MTEKKKTMGKTQAENMKSNGSIILIIYLFFINISYCQMWGSTMEKEFENSKDSTKKSQAGISIPV